LNKNSYLREIWYRHRRLTLSLPIPNPNHLEILGPTL